MQQTRAFKRHATLQSSNALVTPCGPSQCRPGLLIGVNTFSKPVHIVANLSEDFYFFHVSSPPCTLTSPLPHEVTGHGYLPHYCMDTCTEEQDAPSASTCAPTASSQIEPAQGTISNVSPVPCMKMCTHAPRLLEIILGMEVVASTLLFYIVFGGSEL